MKRRQRQCSGGGRSAAKHTKKITINQQGGIQNREEGLTGGVREKVVRRTLNALKDHCKRHADNVARGVAAAAVASDRKKKTINQRWYAKKMQRAREG